MVRISPIVFAASLIAVAAAASSPVVGREAPLALFQARGSGLQSRKNPQYRDSCSTLCQPIYQTLDTCAESADGDCACTTENEKELVYCLECDGDQVASAKLNGYRENCAKNRVVKRATDTTSTTSTSTSASASASASVSASASTGTNTTPSTTPATSTTSSTTPATTSQSKSGAIEVRGRAEVLSMLFSLCLMAVLLL